MAQDFEQQTERLWLPEIYREVTVDETSPLTQLFHNEVSERLEPGKPPRVYLLPRVEARRITELGSVTVAAVKEAIESKLPETIFDELDVMTTGIRIAKNAKLSKRYFTVQIADTRLPQERQPILEAVFECNRKLPSFFKDFRWDIVWGQAKPARDVFELPSKLEASRPGTVKLGPAIVTKQI